MANGNPNLGGVIEVQTDDWGHVGEHLFNLDAVDIATGIIKQRYDTLLITFVSPCDVSYSVNENTSIRPSNQVYTIGLTAITLNLDGLYTSLNLVTSCWSYDTSNISSLPADDTAAIDFNSGSKTITIYSINDDTAGDYTYKIAASDNALGTEFYSF